MTPVTEIRDKVSYVKGLLRFGLPVLPASDTAFLYSGPEVPLTPSGADAYYRDPFNASGVAILLGDRSGVAAVRFSDLKIAEEWIERNPASAKWPSFAGPEGVTLIGDIQDPVLDEVPCESGIQLIGSGIIPIPAGASDRTRRWFVPPQICAETLAEIEREGSEIATTSPPHSQAWKPGERPQVHPFDR